MALNRPSQGRVFTLGELNQESRASALFNPSWDRVHGSTQILHPHVHDDLKTAMTEEWRKMWYIYTMEYYSAIKKRMK